MSAKRALEAWERGQRSVPANRAVSLLGTALPEVGQKTLSQLPVGRRDALLFKLRELSLGQQIRGYARCPECHIGLELQLDSGHFGVVEALEQASSTFELSSPPYDLEVRLPDSTDMEAMSRCADTESAVRKLLERCVLKAERKGTVCTWEDLPQEVIEKVGEEMETLDPLADLPLIINCDRCGHQWQLLLDIGEILWGEISAMAKRLLHEVRTLALAYGWSEAEILAISATRRKFYLEHLPNASG